MNEQLENAILKTLAYFDIFDHPLTKEELYHNLWNYRKDIENGIFWDSLKNANPEKIQNKFGFYFLSGREKIVEIRRSRTLEVEKKMKIAKRAIKKITWVPFLKAVFVCNTVAANHPTEKSDIDLFIITKTKRIWIVRFFATLVLKLFGLRTSGKNIKDKVCLSFFVTDSNLNLAKTAIEKPDIYLVYWLDQLLPIYDPENYREKIFQANSWVRQYLTFGFKDYELIDRWKVKSGRLSKLVRKIFEKMWGVAYGDLINSQMKAIQMPKIKLNYWDELKDGGNRVIVDDEMLKFHKNDRREEYRGRWEKRCNSLNSKL